MTEYQVNNPVIWYKDGLSRSCFDGSDGNTRTFAGNLTAPRTYTFPDKSGTIALTSDIIGWKIPITTLVTPPQDGLFEYDGSILYFTIGSTRYLVTLT